MKIGFWGNTNNYPFILARYFKSQNHEVVFIVDEDNKLHRPENRYEDIKHPYPDWITDLSPFPLWLLSNPINEPKKEQVFRQLKNCDLLILNGYTIRFAHEMKRPYMVLLTGADLIPLADLKYADELILTYIDLLKKQNTQNISLLNRFSKHIFFVKYIGLLISTLRLRYYSNATYMSPGGNLHNLLYVAHYYNWLRRQIKKQRDGIKNAISFMYASKGVVVSGDKLLKNIGVDEKKRLFALYVDTDFAKRHPAPLNDRIRIFNVARFNWIRSESENKSFHELDFKGNDIMIKGLGLYYRRTNRPLDIRFVKKGKDLSATIELCKTENISHMITWLDELTQLEVLEEYKKADILFDQLSNSAVTMGGLEGMAVGRPLIANSRPEIYESVLGEKTAICQAKTPEEVCNWLEKLVSDENYRLQKGKESADFVEKHFSTHAMMRRIMKVYESRTPNNV